MKSLENVLFGCTFWSVFSSPDRGYRPVRCTLSTNLAVRIVGTVDLGVPATSPALQSGVRMGLWPIRTPPGCECRWSFESPMAVLPWYGYSRPPMAEHGPKPPPEPTGATWGHSGPLKRSVGPQITTGVKSVLIENYPSTGVKSRTE